MLYCCKTKDKVCVDNRDIMDVYHLQANDLIATEKNTLIIYSLKTCPRNSIRRKRNI